MNILQVIPRFNPILGGGVNVVLHVSKELSSRGHKVTILTTKRYLSEAKICEMGKLGINVVALDYVFDFHLFPSLNPKFKMKFVFIIGRREEMSRSILSEK